MTRAMCSLNWNQAPHNRYSFQRVQSFFPTARLNRLNAQAFAYSENFQDLSAIEFQRYAGGTGTVAEMIDSSFTDSFLVVKSGAIVSEIYLNNMTPNSHHLVNSVTKSYVGMLCGIAIEQGVLNPEAAIQDYLPELDNDAWEGATVRNLLDMTAGAYYHEDYEDRHTDFWKESAVVGWRPDLLSPQGPQNLLDYAASLSGKDQDNGEKFHYRTVTTNVLGLILERAMNAPLEDLFSDYLWSKLHPSCDANVVCDAAGHLYVGAGLSATTRDLACFGMMMTNRGQLAGEQIVPAAWVQDTLAGDACSNQCYLDSEYSVFGFSHYRNQVWVKDKDKGVMLALGIHGQIIYMDQGKDIVIVKLSSQEEQVNMDMFVDAFNAMDAIASSL
ncbi:serine hydrolase domain-containing protein [Pseudoteredinibacter isoporae]|uniref:Beta-lactamase-related domain-containing protein n=1 Tax=Pseudoteredinibacter isoporae TaxID=570281 RepID=A0A7X0MWT4_9GAMM|nr:serine hydrolase [Pseudoteredinibacter isoporae]MBB6521299.1 hypothetical protein [Pseudoteredinibacter isoporae]NHO86857.1 serine hydrolase [Pseudoteredinibacter isoporae]NIB24691.1 serine hydrolase [Pseudoteredinibacter isoporae]